MTETIQYNGLLFRKHPKQNYYYSTASGKRYSRILHRQMWYDVFGEIPKGKVIHHKNHNPFDNRIENFELQDKALHSKSHRLKEGIENPERYLLLQKRGQESARQWHSSAEGILWHKYHAAKISFGKKTYGEAQCLYCKELFIKKSFHAKFCCRNHTMAWRRNNNPDLMNKQCENCNKEFSTFKYRPRRFCSRKCYESLQQQTIR